MVYSLVSLLILLIYLLYALKGVMENDRLRKRRREDKQRRQAMSGYGTRDFGGSWDNNRGNDNRGNECRYDAAGSPLAQICNPYVVVAAVAMAVLSEGKRPSDAMLKRIEREVMAPLSDPAPNRSVVYANVLFEQMECDRFYVIDEALPLLASRLTPGGRASLIELLGAVRGDDPLQPASPYLRRLLDRLAA